MLQKSNWARGTNLSPEAAWLRIATIASFSPSPRLPLGPRRVWAASGSVALSLGWWFPLLETNSKRLLLRGEN